MLMDQKQDLPETDLVTRLRAGEEDAFEALLAQYQHRIYRLARHVTRNREDAEEVVQDTFLSAYRKIGDFDGRAAIGTWLYHIAMNTALMVLRRRRPEPHLSIESELPRFTEDGRHARPIADWSDLPDDPLLAEELRLVLREAIDALPADYKAVVILRDIEGLSNQEAAEVLGATVFAIKSRLHRARLVLRERLTGYFESGREVTGDPSRSPSLKVGPVHLSSRRGGHPGEISLVATEADWQCPQAGRRARAVAKRPAASVWAYNHCGSPILS
jgi:RNA polymerase sigma-70 factor (ECF subfamily)